MVRDGRLDCAPGKFMSLQLKWTWASSTRSLLAPPLSFTALPSPPQTITHVHELNIHLTIVSPAQIPNFHMISDLVTAYGKTVRSTQQVRNVGVVTGHVTICGQGM